MDLCNQSRSSGHFDSSLIYFDLETRSEGCEKAKTSMPDLTEFTISVDGIWFAVQICWTDVLILISSAVISSHL